MSLFKADSFANPLSNPTVNHAFSWRVAQLNFWWCHHGAFLWNETALFLVGMKPFTHAYTCHHTSHDSLIILISQGCQVLSQGTLDVTWLNPLKEISIDASNSWLLGCTPSYLPRIVKAYALKQLQAWECTLVHNNSCKIDSTEAYTSPSHFFWTSACMLICSRVCTYRHTQGWICFVRA